jgi:hypothetical protein
VAFYPECREALTEARDRFDAARARFEAARAVTPIVGTPVACVRSDEEIGAGVVQLQSPVGRMLLVRIGLGYEAGILDAIHWLTDASAKAPLEILIDAEQRLADAGKGMERSK